MEWQPIETAPRDEFEIVLGAMVDGDVVPMEWSEFREGWICAGEEPALVSVLKPTHWMPLPAAPKLNNLKEPTEQ